MIEKILDLHIHSKFSRACSKDLELPHIAKISAIRGIDIIATGDFTHPLWFRHLQDNLIEQNEGIYRLKASDIGHGSSVIGQETEGGRHKTEARFIIGTEISSIKKHAGETRRVHHLVFAPSLEVAGLFNKKLEDRGINIRSDGRPIVGMTSKDILSLMLETDERMVMIPAHAWTPWFGIFGSHGGYNTIAECFEDLTSHIFAIETGLSSDPAMNWRVSMLDNIALISNSDAHSTAKLGREANVMQFAREDEITYDEIMRILRMRDRNKFLYTVEFYPEEGKYHLDGHRLCKFVCTPEETKKRKGVCPVCKKQLVIGVMNRVQTLSDRTLDQAKNIASFKIPYKNLVPLPEIIADTLEVGVNTKTVRSVYDKLIHHLGNEFYILLHASIKNIEKFSSPEFSKAVDRVRSGDIYIKPGYDGEYGVVKVFKDAQRAKSVQVGFDI